VGADYCLRIWTERNVTALGRGDIDEAVRGRKEPAAKPYARAASHVSQRTDYQLGSNVTGSTYWLLTLTPK
jgi:hypothetical protein